MNAKLRVFCFLFLFSSLSLFLGYWLGSRQGLLLGFLVALVVVASCLLFTKTLVLDTYDAVPLEGLDPWGISKIVGALSQKAGIHKPAIFMLPVRAPNIFSLGRSANSGSIVVTQGLMQTLTRDELEAAVAHEISHIQHNDTFVMEVTAVLAIFILGFTALLCRASHLFRRGFDSDDKNVVARIFVGALSPFAAGLIHLINSRKREFLADQGAVELTGKPHALASALWKMQHYGQACPLPTTLATAHLFAINPLWPQNRIAKLFNCHPPVEDRIHKITGKLT